MSGRTTVPLQFLSESNAIIDGIDGGTMTNRTQRVVLLKSISRRDLREYYNEFEKILRTSLERLFVMSVGEYSRRFPRLLDGEIAEKFSELPLGGIQATSGYGVLKIMNWLTIKRALNELAFCKNGSERWTHAGFCKLSAEQQREVIRHAVRSAENLDDLRIIGSDRAKIELSSLRQTIFSDEDPSQIVVRLAHEAESQIARWKVGSHRQIAVQKGQRWGALWFGQYLAGRGVWLLPKEIFYVMQSSFPSLWYPIRIWLTVPEAYQTTVEELSRISYEPALGSFARWVLLATGYSSTVWSQYGFRPRPLLELKRMFQEHRDQRSGGPILRLYKRMAAHFEVFNWNTRPDAVYFTQRLRLTSSVHIRFDWVKRPTPRNSKMAERCLGHKIVSTPEFVQKWAKEFEELLVLTDLEDASLKIQAINVYLTYLMWIPQGLAPTCFKELDRAKHINSFDDEAPTLRNFVRQYFSEVQTTSAILCFGALAEFWQLAAVRGGWASQYTNPIDPRMDRPFTFRSKPSHSQRPSLNAKAWHIIRREHRKNFYQFARSLPGSIVSLRNPTTTRYEEVFWPAEALAIDFILSTGSRHKTGRWIDSGEGDEMIADIGRMKMIPNTSPTATKGRSEGVIRIMEADGRPVLGLYYNHQKTRPGYEFPFLEQELAENLQKMKDLVQLYRPMTMPIRLQDASKRGRSTKKTIKTVYPLLRHPKNPNFEAVTHVRTSKLWVALLKHCEPLVDAALGYAYPLVDGDNALYDIHSLRVTLVSYAFDQGVDVQTVQDMVGHASEAMSWYYRQQTNASIYSQMQALFNTADNLVERALDDDKEAQNELLAQADVGADGTHKPAIEMLRKVWGSKRKSRLHIDFLQSGLCIGGDCSKGLQGGGGKVAVFRERACSRCIYRFTGHPFREGLVNRVNSLVWEIKSEAARAADFARRMSEEQERTGRVPAAMRHAAEAGRRLREELHSEWMAEVITLYRCEAMKKLLPEASGAQVFVAGEGVVPATEVTVGFKDAHDFELLHNLVKDSYILPATALQIPAEVPSEWRRYLHAILRANSHEELMFRLSEEELLHASELLLDRFSGKQEFQLLLEQSIAGQPFPGFELLSEKLLGAEGRTPPKALGHRSDA